MKKLQTGKFADLDDDTPDKPSNRLTKRLLAVENEDDPI
jgi:hypothetical protein